MAEERSLNFLEEIIDNDLKTGKYQTIVTRFPPEPNGYLHLGHAKSICLNFGLTVRYGGKTNLRFDDTNPITEETEYVESIKSDVEDIKLSGAVTVLIPSSKIREMEEKASKENSLDQWRKVKAEQAFIVRAWLY